MIRLEAEPRQGVTKKILLVDDDERLRELVLMTLGNEFEVIEATNGAEGIDAARSEEPAMILLDVNMPGLDGFSACAAITGDPSTQHIPVVMLTGRAHQGDIRKGRRVGARDYIVKPFSPTGLLNKVYEVLQVP